MKHILITGGAGLVGSALCELLVNQQHHVTVLSRHPETVPAKCGRQVKAIESLSNIDDEIKIGLDSPAQTRTRLFYQRFDSRVVWRKRHSVNRAK